MRGSPEPLMPADLEVGPVTVIGLRQGSVRPRYGHLSAAGGCRRVAYGDWLARMMPEDESRGAICPSS
jgi:hypothetical protein